MQAYIIDETPLKMTANEAQKALDDFGTRLRKSMVQMFGSMMKTERNFWNWRNNSPELGNQTQRRTEASKDAVQEESPVRFLPPIKYSVSEDLVEIGVRIH